MLEKITPVILTLDEAPNIGRILAKLAWARDIVLVDSGSTDETLSIARENAHVRTVVRPFDTHADQWNFAISQTGISTEWVLALDADFVLSDGLVEELARLAPSVDTAGYRAGFTYCVDGRPLRATVYPPATVLFRRDCAHYVQDGHTQRVRLEGRADSLSNVIFHDDRKDLSRWVRSQDRYARLEAAKLALPAEPGSWSDSIRRARIVAPIAMLAYCLIWKRLLLDGWPGIFYSFQRSFAELLLSLYLIRNDLSRKFLRRNTL